jgi:hypothetical protein
MRKTATGILAGLVMALNCGAEEIRLQDNVPEVYTVVKGDTLWDISETFLKNPWLWPEIWHVNAQIENPHLIYPGDAIRLIYMDGQPRLTLDTSGRIHKLDPVARVISVGEAIETIPLDKVNSFLSRSRIVSKEDLKGAPYVVSGLDEHLMAGKGDRVYVRGETDDILSVYGVYRKGDEYIDPETREFLGVQALDIGSGTVLRKEDEITTLNVTRTTEEMRIGDLLLREEERSVDSTFYPSSPDSEVNGVILAVEGGVSQVGKLDVVVINRGEREGIKAGNVLSVHKRGAKIRDRVTGDRVQLPDERAGLMMVFRTFEKVSLGLVLEASQGISINDKVANP